MLRIHMIFSCIERETRRGENGISLGRYFDGLCLTCLLHEIEEQHGFHWQDSLLNIPIQ